MLSSCVSQGFLARFVSASQGKMRGVCVWGTHTLPSAPISVISLEQKCGVCR